MSERTVPRRVRRAEPDEPETTEERDHDHLTTKLAASGEQLRGDEEPVVRSAAEPDDAVYTLEEHLAAAAAGAYGPDVRPEHVAGAIQAFFFGTQTFATRAQVQEALGVFRTMAL